MLLSADAAREAHAMRNELVEEFIVDLNKPALFLRKKEPGSDPSMTC
jgi:hypothetical protein